MRLGLVVLTVGLVLTAFGVVALSLPEFGAVDAPSRNEALERHVLGVTDDTGALNSVTAIVFDYRAYDTLGEATVLFTAMAAVAAVLSHGEHD